MNGDGSQPRKAWAVERDARLEKRRVVDGRLVAVEAPRHGARSIYNGYGCRCVPCSDAESEYAAAYRQAAGSGPVPPPAECGTVSKWRAGCHCELCRAAHRRACRDERADRLAKRRVVDGRLVATTARNHGLRTTYNNHGCQCEPCVEAEASYRQSRKAG